MKTAVKQTKGPGMNLGLKKPRFGFSQPKPFAPDKATKAATKDSLKTGAKGVSSGASYLPKLKLGKPKKAVTPAGKSKGLKFI